MLLVFIFVFKFYYDNMMNVTFETNIDLKELEFNDNIDRISSTANINSGFYSGLKTVKRSLQYFISSNNIDSSNLILNEKYNALSKDFQRNTNQKFDMAFYSSNGTNLFRSWENEYADELNSNNHIVNTIINTKRSHKDIEIDKWGVFIKGATPVFNSDSVFIGVVETRFSLGYLLRSTSMGKTDDAAIIINKADLSATSTSSSYKIVNNYFYTIANTTNFDFDIFNSIDISKTFNRSEIIGNLLYYSFPIKAGSKTVGHFLYQVDIAPFIENRNKVKWVVLIAGLLSLMIVVSILLVIGRLVITQPTRKIIEAINKLSEGEVIDPITINSQDEVAKIGESVNKLSKAYQNFIGFAKNIGEGNLDAQYESMGETDEMGNALIDMRKKLVVARDKEGLRKKDEEERAWANNGLYQIGEILRQTTQSIDELSHNILTYLVNYTKSNQGTIFIADDSSSDNPIYEMVAAYAFDRKKYMTKSVTKGEGLIGTCIIEKQTIYMDDIPNNYISITSGLGKSNPNSLIIIPLKVKDKVYGILELASFRKFSKFEIDFLENSAESIASTLSISKINIVTSQLLEQAQHQQEEMRAQEEEMRQNMEELQTTQEEAMRRETEMNGIQNAMNESSLVMMLNVHFQLITMNERLSELLNIPQDSVAGKNIDEITLLTLQETQELKSKLSKGETVIMESKIEVSRNKDVWLKQSYYPILDEFDEVDKIINICEDITDKHKLMDNNYS